jgi:hypothetical protein
MILMMNDEREAYYLISYPVGLCVGISCGFARLPRLDHWFHLPFQQRGQIGEWHGGLWIGGRGCGSDDGNSNDWFADRVILSYFEVEVLSHLFATRLCLPFPR